MSVKSLTELPVEILNQIFEQTPNELKQTCKLFYVMHNDRYYQLLIQEFGQGIIEILVKRDYASIIRYNEGLEYWRAPLRKIVSDYYQLKPPTLVSNPYQRLQFQYIKDSWKLIYSIYKNHRVFIDENLFSKDNGTSKFSKRIYLSPGVYNLKAALQLITSGKINISNSRFSVVNKMDNTVLCEYMPPSHLKDMIPTNKLVMLNMGNFEVKKSVIDDESIPDHLQTTIIPIEIEVSGISLFQASSVNLFYIDISAYSPTHLLLEDQRLVPNFKLNPDWFAWWINEEVPSYNNTVNVLTKEMYESIEHSENQLYSSQDVACSNEVPANVLTFNGDTISCNDYNKEFYKRFNEQGREITRDIKWMTIKDRRVYDELRLHDNANRELLAETPLKFKFHCMIGL